MRVYFTESQIPELAGLNRSQRKIVRRGALEMLRKDQPSLFDSVRLVNGVVLGVAMLIALAVVRTIHADHAWILRAIIFGIIVHGAVLIAQSRMTERLRPYFRSFVEQHRDEMLAAA